MEPRAELRALYQQVDALLAPWTCPASGDCCHFARTGREPYVHAIELDELRRAARAANVPKRKGALAVIADDRRCPMLGEGGRCRVYASRPFGCRTYFCEKVEGPGKLPRAAVAELGRRIADLSERAYPRDPGPRALSRALSNSW